jgi:outer membrane protein OmpA-like peptidoglycan-associated protein
VVADTSKLKNNSRKHALIVPRGWAVLVVLKPLSAVHAVFLLLFTVTLPRVRRAFNLRWRPIRFRFAGAACGLRDQRVAHDRRFEGALPSGLITAALLVAVLFSASANASPEVMRLQEDLIWMGLYAGPLDGELGPGSDSAIRKFQTTLGRASDGKLDGDELSILQERAKIKKAESGFALFVDDGTGARIGVPVALAPNRQDVEYGANFFSNDRKLIIGVRHYNSKSSIQNVFNGLKSELSSTQIIYAVQRPEWFAVAGTGRLKSYYFRFFSTPTGYDGFFAAYDPSEQDRVSPAITMLSLTFSPLARRPSNRIERSSPIEQIPIDPAIASDLRGAVSIGALPNVESKGSPPSSSDDVSNSKLVLDSIERLIRSNSGASVKFFKYMVPKDQLIGFKSDMPIMRVVFNERVFFDTDKSDLRTEAIPVIDSVASSLRDQKDAFALFVAGHTDSRGSDQHNLDLSIRRADSVARALVTKGVGHGLIWRVGFGKAVPLLPNSSPKNMAYNRRVEFLLAKHPTIVAAWVKNTKALCESKNGFCGEQSARSTFDAIPVGREGLNITLQVPARPSLRSSGAQATERPPLPRIILTRPSLDQLQSTQE